MSTRFSVEERRIRDLALGFEKQGTGIGEQTQKQRIHTHTSATRHAPPVLVPYGFKLASELEFEFEAKCVTYNGIPEFYIRGIA